MAAETEKGRSLLNVLGDSLARVGGAAADAGTQRATDELISVLTGDPARDREPLHPTGDQQSPEVVQTGATPAQMLWFGGAAAALVAGVVVVLAMVWR